MEEDSRHWRCKNISFEMSTLKVTLNDVAERKIDKDVEKYIETLFLNKYSFDETSEFYLSIVGLAFVLLFYRRFIRISS